jgi:multidrug efflux pump
VILFGVATSTIFTLLVIPVAYRIISKNSGTPGATSRKVDEALGEVTAVEAG